MPNQTNIEKLREVLSKIADLIRESEYSSELITVEAMRQRLANSTCAKFNITSDHQLIGYSVIEGTSDTLISENTVDYYRKVLKILAKKLKKKNSELLNIDDILEKKDILKGLYKN